MIKIQEVKSKREIKLFVKFPYTQYGSLNNWIPPLIGEEKNNFSKHVNPSLNHCDYKLWLAYKNGKVVGRIAGIFNYKQINRHSEKHVQFGWFDVINDQEVGNMLLKQVEDWAKTRRIDKVMGPFGFTNLDDKGVLVGGFKESDSLLSTFNQPHYKKLLEKFGYSKEIEWCEYETVHQEELPKKLEKISKRAKKRYNIRVIRPKSKKDIEMYLNQIIILLNRESNRLFGELELNKKQINYYKSRFEGFINPKYVRVILNMTDQVIGFGIALPEYKQLLKKSNGKGYLYSLYKFKALYISKVSDTFLSGIAEQYVGKGISAIIYEEFSRLMKTEQLHLSYSYLEREHKNESLYKLLPKKKIKTFRIYKKYIQ